MTTSFTDKKAVTTVSPEARDAWFKWQLTPPVPTSWELPEEAREDFEDAIMLLLLTGEDASEYADYLNDCLEEFLGESQVKGDFYHASAEIWDEREGSDRWKGYIYYHQQDAENMAESGSTYIGFGSFEAYPSDEEAWKKLSDEQRAAVTRKHEELSLALMLDTVIPTLERYGVKVTWNGSYDTRPRLDNVEVYEIP